MTLVLTTQHIATILQHELGLDSEHVVIYNQRHEIPADGSLYITVGMMGAVAFGSRRKIIASGSGLKEETSQQLQETISVEAFSSDTSAIERMSDIIGALNSTYAQSYQETVGFKIASIPTTMNDTTFLEGSAMLYRVSMTFRVLRAYGRQKAIDYYDTFSDFELRDEKGIVE